MRPCPPSPLRALRTSPRLACTLPASPSVGSLWDRPENPRKLAYGQTRTTFFVVAPGTPSAALPALTHAFPRTSARAQSPPSPHACQSACAHASTRPRQRSSLLHASLSLPVACPRPAPRALCTPASMRPGGLGSSSPASAEHRSLRDRRENHLTSTTIKPGLHFGKPGRFHTSRAITPSAGSQGSKRFAQRCNFPRGRPAQPGALSPLSRNHNSPAYRGSKRFASEGCDIKAFLRANGTLHRPIPGGANG